MKSLRKKTKQRTVEAYACGCDSPEHCIEECHGFFDSLQLGIQTTASVLQNLSAT